MEQVEQKVLGTANTSTGNNNRWEDRYMQVVWAKSGSFPWWPSYVMDPTRLSPSEEGFNKAQQTKGKQYVVLFYADKTLGFIYPKDMKVFNDETLETYRSQKVSNKYKAAFPMAVEEALADSKLDPNDRLSWYFQKYKEPIVAVEYADKRDASYFGEENRGASDLGFDFINENELEFLKVDTKSKSKKLEISDEIDASQSIDEGNLSDSYSMDEEQQQKKRSIKRKRIDSSNKKSVPASDAVGEQKKKRGRPKGSTNQKTVKLENRRDDEGSDEDFSIEVDKASSKKRRVMNTKDSALSGTKVFASDEVVSSSLKKTQQPEESKLERLSRLANILLITIAPHSFDLKRALKTMNKINEVENISVEEFVDSGIVAAVKAAKKSESAELRKIAECQIVSWKEKTAAAATAAAIGNGMVNIISIPKVTIAVVDTASTVTPSGRNSSEVKTPQATFTLERLRALRMLKDVMKDDLLASRLEETLFRQYGLVQSSLLYFEAVTRIFYGVRTETISLDDIRTFILQAEEADGNHQLITPLVSFHSVDI